MIENKKEFFLGAVMMALFIGVMVIFFSPVFNGTNGLQHLDSLYNSISKGSAYYIPTVQEKVKTLTGKPLDLNMAVEDESQAARLAVILQKSGAEATAEGKKIKVKGDLGGLIMAGLADADLMYHNDGKPISDRYGIAEKQVLYDWWRFNKNTVKELNKKEQFKEGLILTEVNSKAIETAYNYYKIEAKKITSCVGIVSFSLIFYVIYTMWYGYAILFMFEGWGLKFGH